MPHRCVRCGKIYDSVAKEILEGCTCGSHYFFFFKEEDVRLRNQTENLTNKEREEILQDVKEIVGEEPESPVVLDLESIRVKKAGKFEIDLVNLFKRKPVVYKLGDGKYIIDIPSTFQLMKPNSPDNLKEEIKENVVKDEEDEISKVKEKISGLKQDAGQEIQEIDVSELDEPDDEDTDDSDDNDNDNSDDRNDDDSDDNEVDESDNNKTQKKAIIIEPDYEPEELEPGQEHDINEEADKIKEAVDE